MMKKYWRKIIRQVLFRGVPHAVLSWRYLLPKQSDATHLHKRVFKQAWAHLPRPAWWAMALYSYSLWYLWQGWWQIFRVWRKVRPRQAAPMPISARQQLLELWWLTFAHCVPPHFYYRFQLYRFAEKQWLDFVYNHELPHWHIAISPNATADELRLISDKQAFAQAINDIGLPAVPTVKHYQKGEVIDEQTLWQQQSLFIKPVCGSRKAGCYELHYQPENGSYRLRGTAESCDRSQILQQLQKELNTRALLIQPLLANHPAIAPYCHEGQLATIRLVTVNQPEGVNPLCATLEIPLSRHANRVCPVHIDISTGETLNSVAGGNYPTGDSELSVASLIGHTVSSWEAVVMTAQRAHTLFPNIQTIGWDLALSGKGVVLIEGNLNWGVAVHQAGGHPLLNKGLSGSLVLGS